jgi:hypothetical protein
MSINFKQLQQIYNQQINSILAVDGLTTECVLNYGVSKRNLCPNCIFDVNLKKSSNKYKIGGPAPFVSGMICPYCNGIGYYGEIKSDQIYLAVLWDYKKWISPPLNISNPEGYIQTICHKSKLAKIRQAKDITVILNRQLSNPIFELYEEPTPAGLGDNEYLFCMWKKIGSSNSVPGFEPPPPKCYSDTEKLELICDFINKCFSAIIGKNLDCDLDNKCRSEFTKLELLCNEIDKCSSNITNFALICEEINKCYSTNNSFDLLCSEINKCGSDPASINNLCGTINGCVPDSVLKIKLGSEPTHISEPKQLNIISNVANKCNNIKKLALS